MELEVCEVCVVNLEDIVICFRKEKDDLKKEVLLN